MYKICIFCFQENLIGLIKITVGYCQKAESSVKMEQMLFVELQRYISELKVIYYNIIILLFLR